MIEHVPYGIDDPYKSSAVERFPRDPGPGEPVQVGFRTEPDAAEAWLELRHLAPDGTSAVSRVDAVALGAGLWTAFIGPFAGGRVEYELVAARADGTERAAFAFDVGRWVEVTGVEGADRVAAGARLALSTSAGPATLLVRFPTQGACRLELFAGPAEPPARGADDGAVAVRSDADAVEVLGGGLRLTVDRRTLGYAVSLAHDSARPPAHGRGRFSGSLAVRWLQREQAFSTPVELAFSTEPGERLYGLGERFVGPDRSGESWDVRVYEEYKEQRKRTYLPVPFLVSNRGWGLWLDAEEPSRFDLTGGRATVSCERLTAEPRPGRPLLAFCVFAAERPYDVTAAFTRLTGEIAVPPRWAFGPWMSANTWNSQAKAEAAVERTLAEDVPATVLVLEAWSDEATFYVFNDAEYAPVPGGQALKLKDFRFGGRWPDPKRLVDRCHEQGIRVLLWQIPVLREPLEPNPQHEADREHAVREGFVVRNVDGTPYRNKGWWFPEAMVLDFTDPRAREWWLSKRRYLVEELGVDGFKTDGGEHLWGRDLRAYDGRRGLELFNAYPNLYVGAYQGFVNELRGGDGLTFSRAGYTGAQRFPAHWAGDEDSTWSAYRASIRAGLSAGVSGVSMWSWDIAGFSGDVPPAELYLRATAMAALCPLMQYHTEGHGSRDDRDRTPWNVAARHGDPTVLDVYRRYAKLRMRLIDWLHGEAVALSAAGLPLMRYPALEYPDEHDFLAQDEFAYLLGRDLLVAPVTERGVGTREVRLPSGEWVDAWSGARLAGGRLFHAPAPVDRIPVFVKADSPRLGALLESFAAWQADEAGPRAGGAGAGAGGSAAEAVGADAARSAAYEAG